MKEYVSGWQSVLYEHPGSFSPAPLKEIAEKINHIIRWHAQEKEVLNHGDFHFDNLLITVIFQIFLCRLDIHIRSLSFSKILPYPFLKPVYNTLSNFQFLFSYKLYLFTNIFPANLLHQRKLYPYATIATCQPHLTQRSPPLPTAFIFTT